MARPFRSFVERFSRQGYFEQTRMISDRTEWPTEEKLQSLRDSGIIPYSYFATRCGAALAVIVSLFATRDAIGRWVSTVTAILKNAPPIDAQKLKLLARLTVEIGASSVLAMILGILLTGFLQTKFLMHKGLTFDMGRLARTDALAAGAILRRLLGALFTFLIVIGFAVLLLFAGLKMTGIVLVLRREELLGAPSRAFEDVMPFVIAAFGTLGAVAFLLEKFRFLLRHRMSRQELTKASAETE